MKGVLCLVVTIACCAAATVGPARQYYPEERDVNYKRFLLLKNKAGDEEMIDLRAGDVAVRAEPIHVTYYLYTKTNLESPHIIRSTNAKELSNSPHFDPKKKTFFIIHGWVDDYTADVNRLVKAAVLKNYDVNIVVVDWSPVAAESYITSMAAVSAIGGFVADFINNMIDSYGLNGSNFVIIGHSLGAHISGNAGSAIKSRIAHIIGLDPASPLFSVDNIQNRLDPSDADYVQVIHTNGRFLGFSSSIGHADYYPNGGLIQAGCGLDLLGGCSHARAFEYLAEAIDHIGQYVATLCGSYSDYQNKRCSNNKKVLMGSIEVDKTVVGDFFLDTKSSAPFAQG